MLGSFGKNEKLKKSINDENPFVILYFVQIA